MGDFAFYFRPKTGSGEIRGRQVCDALGAKDHPLEGYEDDICIGVKFLPGRLHRTLGIHGMKHYFLDLIDHSTCLDFVSHHPDIKLITASKASDAFLRSFLKNQTTFIPQHHCNMERLKRPDRPVKIVGYMGFLPPDSKWAEEITKGVESMGLRMKWYTGLTTREEIVRAYAKIDIQFSWRGPMPEKLVYMKPPLRVINAASFGIPSVALKEPGLDFECKGCYLPAETIPEALEGIRMLSQDEQFYNSLSGLCRGTASLYHIDSILPLYRHLAKDEYGS